MNISSNKIIIAVCIVGIILAGVFCSAYFQMSTDNCAGTASEFAWCTGIISHGSIIDSANLSSFFIVLLLIVSLFLVSNIFSQEDRSKSNFILNKKSFSFYKEQLFYILNPLQAAFSRGILHPKKPNTF